MPALYAELPPSTVASRIRPSLSWPTAARALRRFSTGSPNDSRARKTGLPAATSSGPPPIALCMLLQFGVSVGRISTVVPTGASAARCGAWLPRDTSTAPPGGIGTGPWSSTCVTAPVITRFGVSGGSADSTSITTPLSDGVAGPHDDV